MQKHVNVWHKALKEGIKVPLAKLNWNYHTLGFLNRALCYTNVKRTDKLLNFHINVFM